MTSDEIVRIPVTLSEMQGLRIILRLLWTDKLASIITSAKAKPETTTISIVAAIMDAEDTFRGLERDPHNLAELFALDPKTMTEEWELEPSYVTHYQKILSYPVTREQVELVFGKEYVSMVEKAQASLRIKFGCTEDISKKPDTELKNNVPTAVGKN
jgi:hypothetical protein